MDVVGRLMEIFTNVEGFVVVCGDVEEVGDVSLGVVEFDSLGGSEDGFDAVFWVRLWLLLRVSRFWEASRLPMKSPPLPSSGSRMQEQSSGQTCWGIFQIIYKVRSIIFYQAISLLISFKPDYSNKTNDWQQDDSAVIQKSLGLKRPIIGIIMSRKLKFKIISCSSQEQEYPISSLLFAGSQGWQTRRFCTYPQEVTLEFYGIVNIKKIQLVSHHTKIASQVDILYYVPTGQQDQRFYKYGYLQFNRNEGGNAREQKTIMVDINCLYLRFLFHKPHPSRQNFFSQIGLQALSLYGSETPENLLAQQTGQEEANEEALNQEDEAYVEERIGRLTVEKDKAISDEDYQSANYYKNTINLILQVRGKLRENRAKINKAIESQDYETAKAIKEEIKRHKEQIDMILEDKMEEAGLSPELEENQFAEMHKSQEQLGNQFMESSPLENSRQSRRSRHSSKFGQSRAIHHATVENYDERVIPTLRPGHVKTEPQEQGEERPKPAPPVEEVEGKYIKDATVMQEYFDEQTVKKFFSMHWQHNLQSLTSILNVLPSKHKDAGLIKCLITVVKYSSKQINFQVSIQSLKVLQEMLKMNNESQALTKPGEHANDLDEIGKEIVKKLSDNNIKIKTASQQAFAQMNSSLLYGVEACSYLLAKYKGKLSGKQITTRLSLLNKMVSQYGLGGGGTSVPPSALDFALQHLNNPAEEARKLAIGLLATAYKKDPARTEPKLSNIKQSIQEQIREGGGAGTPPLKHKKK